MIHVYTSIAENYLPKAIVWARSIRKHQPNWKIHLLLVQETVVNTELIEKHFDDYHLIQSLNIPSFKPWSFCHTVVELSTAVKPFLLSQLLSNASDCSAVVYIDPDIVLFSELTEIEDSLKKYSIVLTPHQTTPEVEIQGVIDNEICSLQHGTYNLGFVGVANDEIGRKFAKWWSDRTYHFCRDEKPNGLFTDQKWIDLVPALFDQVKIERNARFNIATWNIRTRKLGGAIPDALTVNEMPIGFYHFTGFDSGAHELMANIYGKDQPILLDLIKWYHQETNAILDKMKPFSAKWPYAAFDDGTTILNEMRYVYRERADLRSMFPNPFQTNGTSNFKDWWFHLAKYQYPLLFSNATRFAELTRLKARLTKGFYEVEESTSFSIQKGFKSNLRKLMFLLKIGFWIPKRIIFLFYKEGLFGIYVRVKK